MASAPVLFDMSKAQPIQAATPPPASKPLFDMTTAQPIQAPPDPRLSGEDQLSAAPPNTLEQTLENFRKDVTDGGGRTAVGRLLGHLQGNGDKGYSGLNSGVSPGAASFVGSPLMGTAEALHSASTIPAHPVTGTLHTIGGLLHAAELPSFFVGGDAAGAAVKGAKTAVNAIPSTTRAGAMLGKIGDAANAAGVTVPLTNAIPALERTQQLASAGASPARAADLLYQRAQTINPLSFQEARDFSSNIANLSRQERLAINGQMQAAVQRLKTGLNADLTAAAGQVNMAPEYAQALKEYAQASQLGQTVKKAGKYVAGTALGAYGYSKYQHLMQVLSGK